MYTCYGKTEYGKSTISRGTKIEVLEITAKTWNNLICVQLIFVFDKGKISRVV